MEASPFKIEITELREIEFAVFVFWDFYQRKHRGARTTDYITGVFIELSSLDGMKSFKDIFKTGESTRYVSLPLAFLSKLYVGDVFADGALVKKKFSFSTLSIPEFRSESLGVMDIGTIYKEAFDQEGLFRLESKFSQCKAYFFSHRDQYVILPLSVIFKRFCCYDPIALDCFFKAADSIYDFGVFKSIKKEENAITLDLEIGINKKLLDPLVRYVYFDSFFLAFSELQQRTLIDIRTSDNREACIFMRWPYFKPLKLSDGQDDEKKYRTEVDLVGISYNFRGKRVFLAFDIGRVEDEMDYLGIDVRGTKVERVQLDDLPDKTRNKTRVIPKGKSKNLDPPTIVGGDVDTIHQVSTQSRIPPSYFSRINVLPDKIVSRVIQPGKTIIDSKEVEQPGLGEGDDDSDTGQATDKGSNEISRTGLYALFGHFVNQLQNWVATNECVSGSLRELNLIFEDIDRDVFSVAESKEIYNDYYQFTSEQTEFCYTPIGKGQKIDKNKRKRRFSFVEVTAHGNSCIVLEIEPKRSVSENWYVIRDGNVDDIRNFLIGYVRFKDSSDELKTFMESYVKEIIGFRHPISKLRNSQNELEFSDTNIEKYTTRMVERVLDYLK